MVNKSNIGELTVEQKDFRITIKQKEENITQVVAAPLAAPIAAPQPVATVQTAQAPVAEKQKLILHNYEPAVSVSTKKRAGKIEIRVKDNGMGIPSKVLDKIFQPFFTTKPAGQGTGLGLSLSYDIVKAHGGDLQVETSENLGTEFIIQLPAP